LPSFKNGSNVPGPPPLGNPLDVAGTTLKSSFLSIAPLNDVGIILTNPQAMSLLAEHLLNNDPLKALDEEDMVKGAAGNNDAEIFKNLPIIEDVKMSSDSSKRKRKDVGDDPP